MPEQELPPEKRMPSPEPPWQVILEDIRSQNRATMEAVVAFHGGLDRKIEEHRAETRAHLQVLEAALRLVSADLRGLTDRVETNSSDIRGLTDKVETNSADIRGLQGDVRNLTDRLDPALSDIEGRVSALERRRG